RRGRGERSPRPVGAARDRVARGDASHGAAVAAADALSRPNGGRCPGGSRPPDVRAQEPRYSGGAGAGPAEPSRRAGRGGGRTVSGAAVDRGAGYAESSGGARGDGGGNSGKYTRGDPGVRAH